jgi:glycosyltransferase involved in cell wall biosynthesis
MRIMHISTRLILGGSQENTILSCEGQAENGHDVALVFGPIYGPEGSMLQRVEAHGGIETIETPNLVRQLAPLKDFRCKRDLLKLIEDWKPDVVHTHSSKAGILGRLAAWKAGVPCVIHTIHGLAFHPYQAKWKNAIYILSERIAAKRCHIIACVADAMRDQALAAKIGEPEQYVTVYSGMEVDRFVNPQWTRDQVRAELNLAPDDFVIGVVSRLAELKGHDDLLDALGDMMAHDRNMKMLWVGDGWWRDRLLNRVKDMGLSDQVVTTGLVDPDQIPKYMQAMDVLAHMSYREGLPRVVTQGLLSALPAVAYDVDGTREVCVDGETGRLLTPGDRAGLAEAIAQLRDDPALRNAMGIRGREKCRQQFSAERMVQALEEAYASVLNTK